MKIAPAVATRSSSSNPFFAPFSGTFLKFAKKPNKIHQTFLNPHMAMAINFLNEFLEGSIDICRFAFSDQKKLVRLDIQCFRQTVDRIERRDLHSAFNIGDMLVPKRCGLPKTFNRQTFRLSNQPQTPAKCDFCLFHRVRIDGKWRAVRE